MQHSVDKFSDVYTNFSLTISTTEIEVMHQPAQGEPCVEPNITINSQKLKAVDRFMCLGSTLSRSLVIDDKVNARIAKARATFSRLHNNVWNRRAISPDMKL